MMSNDERLVYMVNQIARNFAMMGGDKAADATADHIVSFWDPRMKARILALHASALAEFTPIAEQAIEHLRGHNERTEQTAATVFNAVNESGRCDAG